MPVERPMPAKPAPAGGPIPAANPAPVGGAAPYRLTLAPGEQPETDLEVKRSHFLARAERADDEDAARSFIARIRSRHPDARHHCSAFIVPQPGASPASLASPGSPAIERSSDDGEPSGTAGQPILEVLRGSGLTGAAVVVTRYFGGTLLGTGGLVRAYSEAASQALAAAARVSISERALWEVRVPVARAGRLEAELRAAGSADGALAVEGTSWGASDAVILLSTSVGAPSPDELIASLTAGSARPAPAGTRLVESPL
ncbi:IMPACT family protein [Actinomyces marmotae]|uniref:YigZ family protein n=1 Tax=Actinomyces marmotae TaxID=2737173 RepID=A0A6M8B1E3_9ACTO|nr:YigZ family protein [Actinomyces marmotae]QKD80098.1 YigZ family protein [Actinomyces marmotae]